MIKFLFTSILAAVCLHAQNIPQNYSLYTDKKAMRSEDIITVLVFEEANAKNDTRTETDVNQGTNFQVAPGVGPLVNKIPGMSLGMSTDAEYDGRGKTARSGQVKAKVSARILAVYDNGNLLVDGHKEVDINNETEIIHVSGIIRPEDIRPDNTIYSFNMADAKIQYMGKGDTQDAQRPGLIARFFNWIF